MADGQNAATIVQEDYIDWETHETRVDRVARDQQQAGIGRQRATELQPDQPRPKTIGDFQPGNHRLAGRFAHQTPVVAIRVLQNSTRHAPRDDTPRRLI